MMTDDVSQQLARLEQSLEHYGMQKKQFRSQLAEAEAALEALDPESGEAFRVIGNLMVKQPADKLVRELSERKETLKVRLETIEQQEGKLRQQLKDLRGQATKEEK